MLSGKKTYIIAFVAAILTGIQQMGWITPEMYQTILQWLGIGALVALRSAVK